MTGEVEARPERAEEDGAEEAGPEEGWAKEGPGQGDWAAEAGGEVPAADLPAKLALVLAVCLALGLAFFVGSRIGVQRAEREARDPLEQLDEDLRQLGADARGAAPPLLGGGRAPDEVALVSLETRLADLVARAQQEGLPLDTLNAQTCLARARFEAAVRAGKLDAAAEQVARLGRSGEEAILRARLELARGRDPDPAWLSSWIEASDPEVAEAARVLLAWQVAADDPRQARGLLGERVAPGLARPALARVELVEAALALEPHRIQALVQEAGPRGAHAPRVRRRVLREGLELCEEPTLQPSHLLRVVKVVALLRGDPGPDGPAFARAALGVARVLEGRLGNDEDTPRRLETLLGLVNALAASGLRAGPCREGGLLLDATLGRAELPAAARAELARALARLDLPFYAPQLERLPLEEIASAAAQDPCARALVARVRGGPELSALADAPPKPLGPALRAQLLLAAGGAERAKAALELDPRSPEALLATWCMDAELPADASTQLGERVRELARDRPTLRPLGATLLEELAALQEQRGQAEAAAATRAAMGRWFGAGE
ncbi:MAG: hypothetical protein AB7N76_21705 [Planctomycetota bacterium]